MEWPSFFRPWKCKCKLPFNWSCCERVNCEMANRHVCMLHQTYVDKDTWRNNAHTNHTCTPPPHAHTHTDTHEHYVHNSLLSQLCGRQLWLCLFVTAEFTLHFCILSWSLIYQLATHLENCLPLIDSCESNKF